MTSTSLDEAALRPCPFCGGGFELDTSETVAVYRHRPLADPKCPIRHYLIERDDPDDIAAWNRRATPPSTEPVELAALYGNEISERFQIPGDWHAAVSHGLREAEATASSLRERLERAEKALRKQSAFISTWRNEIDAEAIETLDDEVRTALHPEGEPRPESDGGKGG
jgi:hypothetical protein